MWCWICAVGSWAQHSWNIWGKSFRVMNSHAVLGSQSLFLKIIFLLETLVFLAAEKKKKSLKTQNLTTFWSVTHDFLLWRVHAIAFFQLPFVSLHATVHLQMVREECLRSCTLKAASAYAKASTRLHRCQYPQRAGTGVLLDRIACI